jgi:hypothetical protein
MSVDHPVYRAVADNVVVEALSAFAEVAAAALSAQLDASGTLAPLAPMQPFFDAAGSALDNASYYASLLATLAVNYIVFQRMLLPSPGSRCRGLRSVVPAVAWLLAAVWCLLHLRMIALAVCVSNAVLSLVSLCAPSIGRKAVHVMH